MPRSIRVLFIFTLYVLGFVLASASTWETALLVLAGWLLILLLAEGSRRFWLFLSIVPLLSAFSLSPSALHRWGLNAGWVYDFASASPVYQILREIGDPWVSEAVYADSPMHFSFEPGHAVLAGFVFLLAASCFSTGVFGKS